MVAGRGADRIADDTASALASGVMFAPALFIDGERYRGELEPAALLAALETTHVMSARHAVFPSPPPPPVNRRF